MYWSRTGSVFDILALLTVWAMWWTGGWLITTHAFRLHARMRLLSGFTTGLLLYIFFSNLIANFVPVTQAFWFGAVLVLLTGILIAWRSSQHPWLNRADLQAWHQIVTLLALTMALTLIGRGLALFDDYLHLPLVSVMAASDIPPHFYLNPPAPFAYHYGLQVFAASMVRLGGFFPWSAWDFSKALAIALTLVLAWLWLWIVIRNRTGATFGAFLITFAGGARWLLLFLPIPLLLRMTASVQLANTGADSGINFLQVLSQPWLAEGSGAVPFPFAFHNGIFVPVIFSLGASGAIRYATVILMLILARSRRISWPGTLVLSLLFTTLALTAEHIFVFLGLGIFLAGGAYLLRRKTRHSPLAKQLVMQWGMILLIGGVLSLIQGAFLTEAVRNLFASLQGVSYTQGNYNYFSLILGWPPALNSAHFGELSLLSPGQFIVLLTELGAALLLAPYATYYAWQRLKRGDWLWAGLGIAALLSMFIALFFRYGVERSSNRLPATSLWIWVLLGYPVLWQIFQKANIWVRTSLKVAYAIAVFGGIVIFAIQLTTMPAPQLTYFVNAFDARIGQEYWNQLPENAEVFDSVPHRSVTLFGRASRAKADFYNSLPEWKALFKNPDPVTIAQAGYDYVYIDAKWWWEMEQAQREAFSQSCVQTVVEQLPDDEDYRWLLDIRSCR